MVFTTDFLLAKFHGCPVDSVHGLIVVQGSYDFRWFQKLEVWSSYWEERKLCKQSFLFKLARPERWQGRRIDECRLWFWVKRPSTNYARTNFETLDHPLHAEMFGTPDTTSLKRYLWMAHVYQKHLYKHVANSVWGSS